MTAPWMLYTAVVTALLAGAAWALERPLRAAGRPTRWVWLGAGLGAVALALLAVFLPGPPAASPGPALAPAAGSALVAEPPPGAPSRLPPPIEALLAVLWTTSSLTMAVLLGRAGLRLRRARACWQPAELDGRRVLRSDTVGPAVVGVLRGTIVVPAWAFGLPAPERDLMLRHEEEHLHAGDARTVAAGLALLVAMPWNPALWWIVLRLRQAVEIDCDRRVLDGSPDTNRYARLLLTMVERGAPVHAGALAFVRPAPFLERRIRNMSVPRRASVPRTVLFAAAASILGFAACQVDRPTPVEPRTAETVRTDDVDPGPMVVEARAEGGTIVGTVTDRESGAPLESAQVFLPQLELGALTNRVGRFLILGVAPGEHELLVQHPRLGRHQAVTVTVTEETPEQAAARRERVERIRAIRELQEARARAVERVDTAGAASSRILSARPSSGRGAITGTVVDRNGDPVAAAEVLLPALGVGALTNQDGRFLIFDVPPGTHTLSVVSPGGGPGSSEIEVDVEAGETTAPERIVLERR